MTITATTRIRRALAFLAAAATLAVVGVADAAPASAAFPPAAAGNTIHGFVARHGAVRTIDHPRATTVPATPAGYAGTGIVGVNGRGDMVGLYEDRGEPGVVRIVVRDRSGRFTTIPDHPGAALTEPVDITNRGEIVGFYYETDADLAAGISHGFRRSADGRYRTIDMPGALVTRPFRINDRGQIAGHYVDDRGLHGFVWHDGEIETVDVPGAVATVLYGINNRGQTVGAYYGESDVAFHGFVREPDGRVTTVDVPGDAPEAGTQFVSINDRGQIAATVDDGRGSTSGFLYERGRFTPIRPRDAVFTRPLDINDRGQVVGDYGTRPRTNPTAGPEPPGAHLGGGRHRDMEGVLP
jgi:uncharacterized membrane protein